MSAQVEEVTASAQSLAEMAQALQKIVAQFKLSEEIAGSAPALPGAKTRADSARTKDQAHVLEVAAALQDV
jgi:hypothetical protein